MNRHTLWDIKRKLDQLGHCGDYGYFYIHKTKNEIYLNLGDADEVEFSYDGFKVLIEAEADPEDLEDWILISRGIEIYEKIKSYDAVTGEFTYNYETYPNLISPKDYTLFYEYFKQLKD